jgi:hypothetical protein
MLEEWKIKYEYSDFVVIDDALLLYAQSYPYINCVPGKLRNLLRSNSNFNLAIVFLRAITMKVPEIFMLILA